jgi:hypothetical protein
MRSSNACGTTMVKNGSDKTEYFNQMNVSNDQELIDNIMNKVKISIINYQQSTNNIISQPKMKKFYNPHGFFRSRIPFSTSPLHPCCCRGLPETPPARSDNIQRKEQYNQKQRCLDEYTTHI